MAQERKKRRIVLASILKPVDDTRMFEKMAGSLAKDDQFEVFVVGYPSGGQNSNPRVGILSIAPFPRLSVKRILAKWKVFQEVRKLKPSIFIFNTHELLLPAILLKIITPVSVIYDVRENYYRNILYSESFPWFIRRPLAGMVRFKEKLLAPSVDHFFLAEKCYEKEFNFYRGGWTVIENKTSMNTESAFAKSKDGTLRLLFSGTLAESTGVFRAITLAKGLHALDNNIRLTIIGRAAIKATEEKIRKAVAENSFIEFIGGDELVPHTKIAAAVQQAGAGILSYPSSPHTDNSSPTKLFEYLHACLPIILEKRWSWIPTYMPYHPFVFVNFESPDYSKLLSELKTTAFYTSAPADVTWQSEEEKLFKALNQI